MSRTIRSVRDALPYSVWLEGRPAEPLHDGVAPNRADVLVVGAGLTGLWAGFEAARAGHDTVVVDAATVGFGASSRCGGFINASITHGIANGHARWPEEMPRIVALQEALWHDTVALLDRAGSGDVIEPCGKLTVAVRPHHHDGLATTAAILRRYDQSVRLLGRDELASEVGSPTYLGGMHHQTANGLCHPVALVDAVARLARATGCRIVERTSITSLDEEPGAVLARTEHGTTIRAGRVMLATNAFPPLRRRLRRRMIPVYDHAIATEPLDDRQWESIAWHRRCGITDAGNQFHYYRPTPDGRILFGGWDATYHFGGRVNDRHDRRHATHRMLAAHLIETFPQLDGITIGHAWGGPIDSTSRFTPMFGTAMDGKLGWSIGFTGLGVGASRFGALAALDLVTGSETERTDLSMVRRAPLPFPPEPLRWPVVEATKRALAHEDRTGRRNPWLRLLDRLGVGFDT